MTAAKSVQTPKVLLPTPVTKANEDISGLAPDTV